jgi:HK97 family phage prohead protease
LTGQIGAALHRARPDLFQKQRSCSMQVATKAAGKPRTYRFVASTPNVDRAGDTIQPNWNLDSFRRTGMPILLGHDYSGLPIGRGVSIGLDGRNLVVEIEFCNADDYPIAGTVEKLVQSGFMNSVSVGFKPLKWEYLERGMNILEAELLEVSIVAVPMNAEAVLISKGAVRPVYPLPKDLALKGCNRGAVELWLRSPISKGVPVVSTKAAPPPAAPAAEPEAPPADAGTPQDLPTFAAELMKLLAIVNGSIPQENYDKALAMLTEASGGAAPEPEAEAPAEKPPMPPKGVRVDDSITKQLSDLGARLDQLTSLLLAEERSFSQLDLTEEDENPSLTDALSQLGQVRTDLAKLAG